MRFVELFKMGGWPFMLMVTLLGLAMVFCVVRSYINVYVRNKTDIKGSNYILMFGSLSFIIGLLGQAIGMLGAFDAMESAGDIAPGLVAGGLKVSMIAPLYGMLFFIVSIPFWMVIREKVKKNN